VIEWHNKIMEKLFTDYIQSISTKFSHKETSEMGYRADFEILLKGVFESINVKRIDHDAKAIQGNKPDFAVLKNDVPILYIEAKDIGVLLDKIEKSEQMTRYFGYTNLVLTDYVEFRFYRNGIIYEQPIKIANYDIKNRTIVSIPENYERVAKTLIDFTQSQREPIKSGKHLSKIMGGRAQRIRDNVRQFLVTEPNKNTELVRVYETIKKLLVHDLTADAFADMYAQTLVYGLFVARYYDESKKDFSRQEARDLIPKSNPLLQHFFDHIVGPNFDKRLEYIVNELCEVFSHADIPELMREYFSDDLWGKTQRGPDPVIHFYEDFLKEYDAELRKKMGAYYTPLPVVQFIVRSLDYLLEKEFGLSAGLADTSKTADGIHKVQILDPAVGTGTFISDVIGKIYERILKKKQEGSWPAYVHHDLLPRLHGFELMMTPYTIAHLKLGIAFKKTGFKYFNQRLGIYLTNSLEGGGGQGDMLNGFGFAESIAEESKEASKIKNNLPIMVVIGNPPYSVSSSNKGKWIQNLIDVYKTNLNEKSYNALSDDYIKFIRFAEHFIEKNKTGIVAMITNNSFIDGITHRQMRKHLLETFDDIYILDLHGNSKKKEKTPDGGKDENVFDIQQGVSINIFIRKNLNKEKLGTVYHSELFGKREVKFEALNNSDIEKIKWQKLDYSEPYYFFVPKDFGPGEEYSKGFKIDEIFSVKAAGIKTHHDDVVIAYSSDELKKQILNYLKKPDYLFDNDKIKQICYRPFDQRSIYYDTEIVVRHRKEQIKHSFYPNIALLSGRQSKSGQVNHFFVTNLLSEMKTAESSTGSYHFPLYLYSEDGSKTSNLKKEIVGEIEKIVGNTTPEDIFDYIYAVLHSPNYREKYKEFLKIDFPRVPYPKDKKQFNNLVMLGEELRHLHLLESDKLSNPITTYSISGDDIVEKVKYEKGNIYINKTQCFGDVPEVAWDFYIGGYQPAQKWLKDRKGRKLTNSDIEHYQKIIIALTETDRIMKEIDIVG
jgi:type I restriction-modification system DNA methylase subunit